MAGNNGPRIVRSGLVLCLDAADTKSYSGSGTTWFDLSGSRYNLTKDAVGFTFNSAGYFSMADGGVYNTTLLSGLSTCTCVFWLRTTDVQSLFLSDYPVVNSNFLGAYHSGNKGYNQNCGTPSLYIDTVLISPFNLYDNIRDNKWHMIEFKSVNLSTWNRIAFNTYNTFTFGDGAIACFSIYNKSLSASESLQNFNALRGRFSI
jgi:hypothetical protein